MATLRRIYKSSPRLRRAIRRRKDAGTYWLARLALWLPTNLSLPRALALSDRIGDLCYLTLRRTRQLALEHIEVALGDEIPAAARERLVRASFRNLARCFCELAKFADIRRQLDDYIEFDGWPRIEEVLGLGGGVAITGHIGNWELLGAYCGLKGVPVGAVARRINDPRLNSILVGFRASNGVETILRESPHASRQMLRILKNNGLLALVIDQDTHAPSVSVPFFGRLARTPAAAAVLAVRRNLPTLPVFAQRRPEGGHRLTCLPPLYPSHSGDRRRDILELTHRFSRVLEERIRQNPAEWVWWHRRWRRAPVPRLDLDDRIQYPDSVLS